ncbi:MAG: OmpA family protein, partial [Bacteroidetes bacterium]|nr:OmpA family protein [Bacteroidota bacterium]
MKKLLLTFCSIILCLAMNAQTGDEFFKKKEYVKAMVNYEREVKSTPAKYLPLAKCYFSQRQFDKAIEALKLYIQKVNTADTATANTWIRLLERADDETRLVNMGNKINTGKGEYFPHVSSDGKKLYFIGEEYTSGKGGEDVFMSEKQTDGTWGTPTNVENWNTTSHESVMSTSSDGNTAIMFGNYSGTFGGGDLFYSVNTGSGWSMPCNMGGTINTKNWEAQASLGPDGKTLVFCSDREDNAQADIFVSFLSETGWSTPKNIGTVINRKGYKENSPILASDNKTLYFCSNKPNGFGGFDIYMSKRLDDSWTNWSDPVNLGRYINTLEDDRFMTIPASGNKAYTTIYDAPNGFGDYDLYEFILPLSMRPEKTFTVRGKVLNELDSAAGVVIKYLDFETNVEVARISSSDRYGKYYVSLPARKKYLVVIDMKGYLFFQDILDLSKPELYQNKATIQDKMGDQNTIVKDLKVQLDQYNVRLQQLIESKSTEIGPEFKKYQDLIEDYKAAIAKLDIAVYKAKSDWLSEENNLEATVNYKVTRIKIGAKFELKNISFDFGKATLKEESKIELDKLVDIMNRSDIVIELGGHTDNVGSDEANLKLSQERVTSVKTYLESKKVDANRITAVGYGEAQPIASNDNDEGRSKNRRVEVKITEIKPKEGSGDYAKIDQKELDKKIDFAKFDMLTILQKAAKIGGLPEGSYCSDKTVYIDKNYKSGKKESYGGNYKPKFDNNWGGTIDMEEFHYKKFAASIMTFGFKPTKTTFGVGISINRAHQVDLDLVSQDHAEDERRERKAELHHAVA